MGYRGTPKFQFLVFHVIWPSRFHGPPGLPMRVRTGRQSGLACSEGGDHRVVGGRDALGVSQNMCT